VWLYDCRKHPTRTFASVHGKPGEVSGHTDHGILVNAHGGHIEVLRLRPEGGKKMGALDFAREARLLT
jgi:methionyl-tRNA formyltransferase